jgi:hypothetical protein
MELMLFALTGIILSWQCNASAHAQVDSAAATCPTQTPRTASEEHAELSALNAEETRNEPKVFSRDVDNVDASGDNAAATMSCPAKKFPLGLAEVSKRYNA